jgi:uncharacterized protein (TIGR04255 family)
MALQVQVSSDPSTEVSRKQAIRGYLRRSADGACAIQVRVDGFTYSKLPPYSAWPDVRRQAFELWTLYLEAAQPDAVVRVAVRYINRIVPPAGWASAADWITITPGAPRVPGLAAEAQDFVMRTVLPHPVEAYKGTVTVATVVNPSVDNRRGLLLDIDVAKDVELAPGATAIWDVLDNLRDFKNDIFFGVITEKTRELFTHA